MTNLQRRDYFSGELKKALDRNNTTISELSRDAKIKYSRLHHWATARSMPSIHAAQRIADFLGDEEIMQAAILVNTRKCSNCSKDYVQESSQGKSLLCSAECRAQNRRLLDKTGTSTIQSIEFIPESKYEKSISAYCNSCEPAGLCLTPECQLRSVSPLPLFSKTEARKGSGSNWSVERTNAQREHIKILQPKLIAARKKNQKHEDGDKFK